MDERRALMAAIIANPDDDTPRLVLADWLDEHSDKHDQARAEFIRLQIELAKLPKKDARRKKLTQRAEKLVSDHHPTWIAPLQGFGFVNPDGQVDEYSRGFWARLFIGVQKFQLKESQRVLPDAFATVGVETIEFAGTTKRTDAIAASPALRWVARVIFHHADDKCLRGFCGNANCAHLSSIEIEHAAVTDTGLREFAQKTYTRQLRRFALPWPGGYTPRRKYTAAGILAVIESDRFPLNDLCLTNEEPRFDFSAILASPRLKRLTRLALGKGVSIGLVAACPYLTGLRELAIEKGSIENADVDTLLANPALKNLDKLTLWDMNEGQPKLSRAAFKKLRDRFGENLELDYSVNVET